MVAYNFQQQFASPVERGKKRSTIRARRKNGYLPKPGELVDLYTGMRTRACRKLRRVKVKRVTPITIWCGEDEPVRVAIDGKPLLHPEVDLLAQADGFNGVDEFGAFFRTQHGPTANLYLIEW